MGTLIQTAFFSCGVAARTLFVLLVLPLPLVAGEIVSVTPLRFGAIDLNPAGDTVIIAAEHGPSIAMAGRSVVTGGSSGRITLRSADVEHVEILFPATVWLFKGGGQIVLRNMDIHSQYQGVGVDLPGGNVPVEVHVGGELLLHGNEQPGLYSGDLLIELNFH